jgi:hypothetical protein
MFCEVQMLHRVQSILTKQTKNAIAYWNSGAGVPENWTPEKLKLSNTNGDLVWFYAFRSKIILIFFTQKVQLTPEKLLYNRSFIPNPLSSAKPTD